jgi:hypothetical protein
MVEQFLLDLCRIDIDATADDHVFGAAGGRRTARILPLFPPPQKN